MNSFIVNSQHASAAADAPLGLVQLPGQRTDVNDMRSITTLSPSPSFGALTSAQSEWQDALGVSQHHRTFPRCIGLLVLR